MIAMPSSLRLLLTTILAGNALASRISFFSDGECGNFKSDIQGPNGYPNGECSLLSAKGNFSSFKIVRLDRGCDATLYGPDTSKGICSPNGAIVADLGTCYNDSSWTYYSIDTCAKLQDDDSSTSATSPTSQTAASSLTSSPPSSTTASAQPTSPSDSASASTASSTNTGAIAGGVVGGVAGLALIVGGLWFFLRRRKKGGQTRLNTAETAGPSEVSGEPVIEMSGKEVPKPSELPEARAEAYTEPPPQELSAEGESGIGVARGEKPPLQDQ